MIIYTYQPQSFIDEVKSRSIVFVDPAKTNVARLVEEGTGDTAFEAYVWMARKMCEKTGIWPKDVYKDTLPLPKDSDGNFLESNGKKLVLFPFWGWYLTDGRNEKPDPKIYCFDNNAMPAFDWNVNQSKTMLVTLDVPERFVLLSDANAWYRALEGIPCYEYESPDEEARKMRKYEKAMEAFVQMPENTKKQRDAKTKKADELWAECESSWDNILRLEGRELRPTLFGAMEKRDVQAVFPFIADKMIINIENV